MMMFFIVMLCQDKIAKIYVSPTLSPPNSFWLIQSQDMNLGQSTHSTNQTSKKPLLTVYITFDFAIESNGIMERMKTEET